MNQTDIELLRRCAALAEKADKVDTAYSVGAILAGPEGEVLTTGFSRELGETWHAEAVVIEKARRQGLLGLARTLYSSLEPCSIRKSGREPCCRRILETAIDRVVFIAREPDTFVTGTGHETLAAAGVTVDSFAALAPLVEAVNAHVWPSRGLSGHGSAV